MVYVRVDNDGNVLEFPYRLNPRQITAPDDARPVDIESQKLPTKWYEALWYDRVEKQGDNYVLYYTKGHKKYANDAEKKSTLSILIRDANIKNTEFLKDGVIEQSVFDSNKQILDSIDINDESTYDLFDTLSF